MAVLSAASLTGCPKGAEELGTASQSPSAHNLRPIIDSHVHLNPDQASLKRALALFDRNGITKFCTKSAGSPGGRRFAASVGMARKLGDRFAFFANLDWRGIDDPAWPQREADKLTQAVRLGARGIKIFKALGLGVRLQDGSLLAVDDPRLDPIMTRAAENGAIVAIHTGDPKVFFDPPGPKNERHLELLFAPSWSFWGEGLPSRSALLAARDRLIARHPKTTFLLIHLGNNPEDLDATDRLLDKYKNVHVDTSARLGEIGRHPADAVRRFFVKHQDRILFGTDIVIRPDGYQLGSLSIWPDDESDADRFFALHRRYFETDEAGIDHPTPIQGSWTIDAIGLPETVLQKLYVDNAEKMIFSR